MNQITQQQPAVSFKVKKDSNYKVFLTYGKEEVISFVDFQKLAKAIFDKTAQFVTINHAIVQMKDVKMIEPTTDLTENQKERRNVEEVEKEKIISRKSALEKIKKRFDKFFYDEKYGADNWTFAFPLGKLKNKTRVTASDMQECWNEFSKTYPELSQEIQGYEE